MMKWQKTQSADKICFANGIPPSLLLIGVYPLSAFLSICKCLLMDFGTHIIHLFFQLPKRRSLGSMALPLENLGLGAIDQMFGIER